MQIKIFKKEKTWKKGNSWMNIDFYWRLAVLLMFVIFILSSFFGYELFIKINQESTFSPSESSSKFKTAKKERIEKTLEYFSIRKQNSDRILNSPAPVVDPSL